jgi:hypothetical protein
LISADEVEVFGAVVIAQPIRMKAISGWHTITQEAIDVCGTGAAFPPRHRSTGLSAML